MKQNWLRIRISDEEKALIKNNADKLNMSLSEYVRFVALQAKIEVKLHK